MSERGGLKRDILIAALGAGGLAALMLPLAAHLKFDYDEWLEFHAIWQIGAGHKPYVDFYFPRPPYHWVLYAPILRALPQTLESLVTLRMLNLGASFSALALWIFSMLRLRAGASWRTCTLAAVAIVVLQVPVIFTFAQFRPDHIVLALTVLGLIMVDDRRPARWAAAGFLFCAAFLLTPKLALIYAAAVAVFGYDRWRAGKKEAARCTAGFLAGGAGAFVAVNVVALAAGVDPMPYFGVLHRHLLVTASAGYRLGLARMVLLRTAYNPLWLLIFIGGSYAAVSELRESGWRKNKVLVVIMIFALAQPLWVKYIYDQYLYTVLFAWSLPLAFFLHRAGRWPSRLAQSAAALLFLLGAFNALPEFLNFERDRRGLESDLAIGDKLLELAPEGRPVAMQPPRHPVFRENSTLFIEHSITPRGPVTEELMSRSRDFGRLFTFEGYLEQLERRPPSLIWTNPMMTGPEYRRAIDYYVRVLHPKDYEERDVLGVSVLVRRATRP